MLVVPRHLLAIFIILSGFLSIPAAAQVSELALANKAAGQWLHMLDDEDYRQCMESLRYPPRNQRKWLSERAGERAKYGDAIERELESTSRQADKFVFRYKTKFQRGKAAQVVTVSRFAVVRWAVSDYEVLD